MRGDKRGVHQHRRSARACASPPACELQHCELQHCELQQFARTSSADRAAGRMLGRAPYYYSAGGSAGCTTSASSTMALRRASIRVPRRSILSTSKRSCRPHRSGNSRSPNQAADLNSASRALASLASGKMVFPSASCAVSPHSLTRQNAACNRTSAPRSRAARYSGSAASMPEIADGVQAYILPISWSISPAATRCKIVVR